MDRFLSEVPADQYSEWRAFDCIEPLNLGDAILMRLFGGGENASSSQGANWEKQMQTMKIVSELQKVKRRK